MGSSAVECTMRRIGRRYQVDVAVEPSLPLGLGQDLDMTHPLNLVLERESKDRKLSI
jgi:hypothetical protein